MSTWKRIILSPLLIILPAVLLLLVHLGSVLSSNEYDVFEYGLNYATAQVQHSSWPQARADEIVQRSLATFIPFFVTPVVIIVGLAVTFLIIQRRLRLRAWVQ